MVCSVVVEHAFRLDRMLARALRLEVLLSRRPIVRHVPATREQTMP
jgi:hypothetical protein